MQKDNGKQLTKNDWSKIKTNCINAGLHAVLPVIIDFFQFLSFLELFFRIYTDKWNELKMMLHIFLRKVAF